jgi:hypothetical protein
MLRPHLGELVVNQVKREFSSALRYKRKPLKIEMEIALRVIFPTIALLLESPEAMASASPT